jgi:glycosyltransferase involved in cell wall biosynthesis
MPEAKPTILHYFQDFHAWGGIVTHLAQTLPALQEDFQIAFVGTENSPLSRHLKEKGITVHGFPFTEAEQKIKSRFVLQALYGEHYLKRHQVHFQNILRQVKPSIIHTHMGEGDHKLLIKSGLPLVRTFHGSFYKVAHQGKNPVKRLYHQWCLNRFSQVCQTLSGMTIVSQYEHQTLKKENCLPPKSVPTVVLPNGIDLEQFRQTQQKPEQTRQQFGIPQEAKVLGFFSRLAIDKNAEAFLSIAHDLMQKWPGQSNELHFIVGGQGPLESLFKQFSQQHANFHYLGYRTDIATLIDCCDATVNLSLDEGFGLSVLESIAMGCPCIAYAVGGIPEILTIPDVPGASDWLVPRGDQQALIQSILNSLQQKRDTRLTAALKNHADQFSLANHTQLMRDFYHQVLDQSAKRLQTVP